MKKNTSDNNGRLPIAVEHQVNEHTVGGYIIFYFNQRTGKPEQLMNFDSPVHALALQKHISDWSEAIHTVNIENSVTAIQFNLEQLEQMENEEEFPTDNEEDDDDRK